MGNASGKEERPGRQQPAPYPRPLSGGRSASSPQSPPHSAAGPYSPDGAQAIYGSRHGRGSRSELSTLLGLGGGPGTRDERSPEAILEQRRETKAEREARRLERERVNRERERERSMREESVDGGYLVTQGVYTGTEDFSKPIVRQLMIERRIAPFWRGLNDHGDSWTEHQLVAAARGLPIPAADEIPEPLELQQQQEQQHTKEDIARDELAEQTLKSLTVPITARSASSQSEQSSISRSTPHHSSFPISSSPPPSGGSLLRGRAKTLASLTTSGKNVSQTDLQPREMHLPKDPNINGQPIEAYLYKDASECPICFLYYPPYLNHTRCCDQPICSECFVQIKRPDPHQPEHPDPNDPQHANEQAQEAEGLLVSEPSQCPYCAQPEFGVTYEPLPFRRGLTYVGPAGPAFGRSTPMSSSSSLDAPQNGSQVSPTPPNRRRAGSLAVNAPQVISTDKVRPDWATKLASARAHQARRSAAATALHTAAYLMNGRNGPDARGFPGFGRRVMMRRGTGESPGGSAANLSSLAFAFGDPQLQPTRRGPSGMADGGEDDSLQEGTPDELSPSITGPPRHASRRTRVEDLEEMMMMEAIRLSLASEEERRRKEEKEARKDAKKRVKEDKKAEKAARKAGVYLSSGNPSFGTMGSSSASVNAEGSASVSGKGKAIAREGTPDSIDSLDASQTLSRSAPQHSSGAGSQSESAQSYLERSRAQLMPDGAATNPTSPLRPSHLRNLSNVSSDTSSLADVSASEAASPNASGTQLGGSDQGSAGLEPMFNFRSLAQMIGSDDEKAGLSAAEHLENATSGNAGESSRHASEDVGMIDQHLLSDLAESGISDSIDPGAGGLEQSVATLTPATASAMTEDTVQEGGTMTTSTSAVAEAKSEDVQPQHDKSPNNESKAHEALSTAAPETGSV